jgi:hypothetical protein
MKKEKTIEINEKEILNLPNDQELGSFVRHKYYKLKSTKSQ